MPLNRLRLSPLFRAESAVAAVVCALASGLFFRGYDSPLGQSLTGLLNSLALFALMRTTAWQGRNRGILAPMLCFAGALLWLLMVGAVRAMTMGGAVELPLAPDLFLPRMTGLAGGLCALGAGVRLGALPRLRTLACDVLLALIAAHLVLGFIPFLVPGDLWDRSALLWDGRFAGLAGNSNVTAAISLAGALIAVSRWERFAGPRLAKGLPMPVQDMLYGGGLLLCLPGIVLPASRFVLLLALLAFGILLLWKGTFGNSGGKPASALLPWAAGGLAIGGLWVFSLFADRFATLALDGYARWHIWRSFAEMALNVPWTGYGPGAFPAAHLYYYRDALSFAQELVINSPHSLPLQLMLTGGLPYLLLILGGVSLIARQVIPAMRAPSRDPGQAALALAFLSLSGCSLVDILLDIPAGVSVTLFIGGLCWGWTSGEDVPRAMDGREGEGRPVSGSASSGHS